MLPLFTRCPLPLRHAFSMLPLLLTHDVATLPLILTLFAYFRRHTPPIRHHAMPAAIAIFACHFSLMPHTLF
jgi:hypothetical protein